MFRGLRPKPRRWTFSLIGVGWGLGPAVRRCALPSSVLRRRQIRVRLDAAVYDDLRGALAFLEDEAIQGPHATSMSAFVARAVVHELMRVRELYYGALVT